MKNTNQLLKKIAMGEEVHVFFVLDIEAFTGQPLIIQDDQCVICFKEYTFQFVLACISIKALAGNTPNDYMVTIIAESSTDSCEHSQEEGQKINLPKYFTQLTEALHHRDSFQKLIDTDQEAYKKIRVFNFLKQFKKIMPRTQHIEDIIDDIVNHNNKLEKISGYRREDHIATITKFPFTIVTDQNYFTHYLPLLPECPEIFNIIIEHNPKNSTYEAYAIVSRKTQKIKSYTCPHHALTSLGKFDYFLKNGIMPEKTINITSLLPLILEIENTDFLSTVKILTDHNKFLMKDNAHLY